MKFHLAFFLISIFLVGCGGQSGGLAPSNQQQIDIVDVVPPSIESSTENNFKYAESTVSLNGWEAVLDTTDPVENVTLVNGWNVEVKYE